MKKFFVFILVVAVLTQAGCKSKEERAENAKALTRGVWANSVFTNDFAGFKFTLPDGWVVASDEEIATLIGVSSEMMTARGAEVSSEMLEYTTIYDMLVSNPETNANIILMYENLAMHTGGVLINEQMYFEAMLKQMESVDMGYTFSDIGDATVAGAAYKSLAGNLSDYGVTQMYYARKIGNFMVVIMATAPISDTGAIDRMMNNFSKL